MKIFKNFLFWAAVSYIGSDILTKLSRRYDMEFLEYIGAFLIIFGTVFSIIGIVKLVKAVTAKENTPNALFFNMLKAFYFLISLWVSLPAFSEPYNDMDMIIPLIGLMLIIPVNFILLPLVNAKKVHSDQKFYLFDFAIQVVALPLIIYFIFIQIVKGGGWTIYPLLLAAILTIVNIVLFYFHNKGDELKKIFNKVFYLELILGFIFIIFVWNSL